jgi:Mg2+ and Co2+ transporter CorA
MNARLSVRTDERMVERRSLPKGGASVDSDRELMLEDARSISERLWRMARLAQDTAEVLDGRIEEEDLDGMSEAVEVREVLEKVQTLSIEVSEELDAYQDRHGG